MSAFGLAQKNALTAYLIPQKSDLNKFLDLSGNGLVVPYNVAQSAASITDKPPEWVAGTSIATTPVLAATRPVNFTLSFLLRVTSTAAAYSIGDTAAQTFIRTTQNDLRAYYVAADASGNFLISNDQTPALGAWKMFTIAAGAGLVQFYIDGVVVASLAKSAYPIANFTLKYNYNGAQPKIGASLLYIGTTLSQKEIAQNLAYLRSAHGYP